MFEGIHYNRHSQPGQTCCTYFSGDVSGVFSFHVNEERAALNSQLGPIEATRSNTSSHYYSRVLGRHASRTDEEVSDYS
jgi:hypothetical protein